MYTTDDKKNIEFEEEYVENNFWDRNKGLVFKIIIIILCIIVLIWLFKALSVKKNPVDNSIYLSNVDKVRLAAEEHFFLRNNDYSDGTKIVNVSELQDEGLVGTIIDANNKVCNQSLSNAVLTHEIDGYKMLIKLKCSTNDKEKYFYYHNNTLACLNCHGNTKMTGIRKIEPIKIEPVEIKPVNVIQYPEYSCINWSDWTKERVNDSSLLERKKVLVYGVNNQKVYKVIYGDWSSYTNIPIVPNDNLEVETKNVNGQVLYRSRTVDRVLVRDTPIYTKNKYEETSLPKGYVKASGTEEVYYSYKYSTCEK